MRGFGLYGLLCRVFPRTSYATKMLAVTVLATHALLATGSYLLWRSHADVRTVFVFSLAERLAALCVTLWAIWSMLEPLRRTTRFLDSYLRTGHLSELPTEFTDEAGRLMANTSLVVGMLDKSLKNVEHASLTDALTGISNRRYATERIRQDVLSARRTNLPLFLAMVDVDDLKRTNDSQGHAAGDELLRSTANRLIRSLRAGEWVARWGGDEFVVCLRTRDGERRLASINDISLSIGLAELEPGDDEISLFAKADRALYLAKSSGKACVRRSGDEDTIPMAAPLTVQPSKASP